MVIAPAKVLIAQAARWLLLPAISAALVLIVAPYILPLTMQAVTPPIVNGHIANTPTQGFGLEEVILAVRSDLIEIQKHLIERQEAAMFQVETFDIELSFVIKQTSSLGTEAGVPQFLVVSADSEYQAEQVQRIRLHLTVPEPPPVETEILGEIRDEGEAIELK